MIQINIYTSAFEELTFDQISSDCDKWCREVGHTARFFDLSELGSKAVQIKAEDPAIIHLPESTLDRFDLSSAQCASDRDLVLVYEGRLYDPVKYRRRSRRVIHGRGSKSFKWAIRSLANDLKFPTQKVVYGSNDWQYGYLQFDANIVPSRLRPGVVLVHGGFWRDYIDADILSGISSFLASNGYVVFNVEYRRGAWCESACDPIDDVRRAIAWFRKTLSTIRFGASKLFVIGQSAGAQIAHSALSDTPSAFEAVEAGAIRGFISLAGVLDLRRALELGLGDGACEAFFSPRLMDTDLSKLSPMDQKLQVPALLLHGQHDCDVPVDFSSRYVSSSHRDTTLLLVPECDHMDLIKTERRHWLEILRWMTVLT